MHGSNNREAIIRVVTECGLWRRFVDNVVKVDVPGITTISNFCLLRMCGWSGSIKEEF